VHPWQKRFNPCIPNQIFKSDSYRLMHYRKIQ
jgi:hypothetical protein